MYVRLCKQPVSQPGGSRSHLVEAQRPTLHAATARKLHGMEGGKVCVWGVQMVLKCADIGHLAAAPRTHKRWAYQLEEEFFRQGDRERSCGLPLSPLMDRSTQGGMTRSQVLPARTPPPPVRALCFCTISANVPCIAVLLLVAQLRSLKQPSQTCNGPV